MGEARGRQGTSLLYLYTPEFTLLVKVCPTPYNAGAKRRSALFETTWKFHVT